MDLQLFARVIGRHRWLVAGGVGLAFLVAFLSFARVDASGVHYRADEEWGSVSRLLIQAPGSSFVKTAGAESDPSKLEALFQDEGRFDQLAQVYATLATSDAVRKAVFNGKLKGKVDAQPLVNPRTESVLPVIEITGVARTRELSQRIADQTAKALRAYVDRIQNQEKLKPDQRIQLNVLNRAAGTKGLLVTPRSKTLPIVAFATVLMATLGLAFALENKNRRLRPIAGTTEQDADVALIADAERTRALPRSPASGTPDEKADVAALAGTAGARKRTLPRPPLSGTARPDPDDEPAAIAATAPRAQQWRKTEH